MKFSNIDIWGFEHAIRGMRNPLESWEKSDSEWETHLDYNQSISYLKYAIGKNDMELMQKLIKAGPEHRKFMRQIFVSVDIKAPLHWWKEFDTYKVGTVANSTSTMHKLASTVITRDNFEFTEFSDSVNPMAEVIEKHRLSTIDYLERLRKSYNEATDKSIKTEIWRALIEDLPESWLQTRTVTMSYENIFSIVHQRKNHKLTEWSVKFIGFVKRLPYAEELLFLEN